MICSIILLEHYRNPVNDAYMNHKIMPDYLSFLQSTMPAQKYSYPTKPSITLWEFSLFMFFYFFKPANGGLAGRHVIKQHVELHYSF